MIFKTTYYLRKAQFNTHYNMYYMNTLHCNPTYICTSIQVLGTIQGTEDLRTEKVALAIKELKTH